MIAHIISLIQVRIKVSASDVCGSLAGELGHESIQVLLRP